MHLETTLPDTKIKRYITPTRLSVIILLVGYFTLLFTSRLLTILSALQVREGVITDLREFSVTLTQEYNILPAWNAFGAWFVWFIIGAVLYLLIWGLIQLIINSRNTVVVATEFVHPKEFTQSSFWGSIAGRLLMRALGFLFLIIFLNIALRYFIPLAYDLAYATWPLVNIFQSFANAIGALLWLSIVWYGLLLSVRLCFLKPRLFDTFTYSHNTEEE